MGHLKMMGSTQPFISGAISKTVNLPEDATKEDVKDVFIQGWNLGLKAIAVYRDGSKGVQPLSTKKEEKKQDATEVVPAQPAPEPQKIAVEAQKTIESEMVEKTNGYTRIRLPLERPSITHKFSVGGYEGYMTVGLYPDTMKPGELFLRAAKEGSTISGLLDTIATMTSMCLQSGMPLKTLVRKFRGSSFAPAGFTTNPDIPTAKSITDYVFSYIGMKYLSAEDQEEIFGTVHTKGEPLATKELSTVQTGGQPINGKNGFDQTQTAEPVQVHKKADNAHAPACQCGTLMVRVGPCWTCPNCFATTGVCG
jgi:ribonucleoside-diphosphate reductase alpha chain